MQRRVYAPPVIIGSEGGVRKLLAIFLPSGYQKIERGDAECLEIASCKPEEVGTISGCTSRCRGRRGEIFSSEFRGHALRRSSRPLHHGKPPLTPTPRSELLLLAQAPGALSCLLGASQSYVLSLGTACPGMLLRLAPAVKL